ncbi:MAG: SDR family NAD(P)-dependent oxidoreductase [Candidatus Andersenbacteria bacterium]|nr:SDR family NAD(P)-dependent oxidoreductase [Candidatus Andersenbacteria bacterium]
MNIDWTGKNVLVTGSGTGIGLGIALEFGRRGANVALHWSHESEQASAKAAAQTIRDMGQQAHA